MLQNEQAVVDNGPNTAPNSKSITFIQHLHQHGRSKLFFWSTLLFTIGGTLNAAISADFFAIFTLIPITLPIIGFWLIYATSKNPKMPEKTLPSLTLIKIYTIFGLVLISILILLMLSLGVGMMATMHLWAPPEMEVASISILLIVTAMVMILSIIFYFVPAFKILKDIRKGILQNSITTIRGIRPFTIATYIIICLYFIVDLITISNIILFASPTPNPANSIWFSPVPRWGFPSDMRMIVGARGGTYILTTILSTLFGFVSSAGTFLGIIVLNKLNDDLNTVR